MIYFGSFLFGVISSLSLPPFNVLMSIFLIVVPIYNACKESEKSLTRAIFIIGSFSFGWFLISLHWISSALLVGSKYQIILIPFALILIPLYMSLYWILASFLSFILFKNFEARFISTLNFIGFSEILRSKFLSGFPWSSPGQIFISSNQLMQIYSIIGQNGANFLALGLAAIPFFILRKRIFNLFFICIPYVALLLFLILNFTNTTDILDKKSYKMVRVLQPNILQEEKWNPILRERHIEKTLMLSKKNKIIPNLTILPETFVAGFYPQDSDLLKKLSKHLTSADGHLLTGLIRSENYKKYNSALLLNNNGDVVEFYDKIHLVPFGEFNPINYFNLSNSNNDFSKGYKSDLIYIPGIGKTKILICYEIIFPNFLNKNQRPDLIINITNDGWFGNTIGPYQHFEQARIRAIEEGITIIRSANTGISGGINPIGRVISNSKINETKSLDILVPNKLSGTFYSSNRWLGVSFIFFWLIIFSIWIERINKKFMR